MLFADAVDLLLQLDLVSFLYMFWFFIIFDFSRYTLSALATAIAVLSERKRHYTPYKGPISVLLVGHNEGHALRASVLSLHEQTRQDLQIVVIDDGSTDDMAEVGQALHQQGLIDTFITASIRGGKASALNLGFSRCRHEIIVTADIDTSFDRDAIDKLCTPLSDPEVGAVSGNLGVRNSQASLLTSFQSIQYFFSISMGRRFTSFTDILMIVSGAFGAFRREAVVAVGGWDVGPGDDSNLTTKIRRAGWHVRFAHDAWSLTDVPTTVKSFTHQRLRWNRSLIRNRVRKFRSVFNPLSANFSMYDLLGTLNVLFFQVVLSISFVAYIIWLFWLYQGYALVIVIAINLIYLIEDLFVFSLVCIIYRDRQPLQLGLYVFGFWFYKGYFLRTIRLRAYLSELILRRSYKDPYYPRKVRQSVERF